MSSLSCTIWYQENYRSNASQTVWSCLIWVQTVASPQYFCVTFQTNCSVEICMQGYKLQQAKLNLFADKRLCHRDSSKCLSGFLHVIFDTKEPNVLLYTEVGVSSCLLIFYNPSSNDERFRNSLRSGLILTQGDTFLGSLTVTGKTLLSVNKPDCLYRKTFRFTR